jgi:hypothetical protein
MEIYVVVYVHMEISQAHHHIAIMKIKILKKRLEKSCQIQIVHLYRLSWQKKYHHPQHHHPTNQIKDLYIKKNYFTHIHF